MTSLTQYLRQAIRSLRRSPAFTLTVIATLGIGIGLNTAIFTVVDCVLLRPLGYHDADRLVEIRTRFLDENRSISKIGGDDFVDLATQVKGLESVAYYQDGSPDGIRLRGESLYLPVGWISPSFTQVMGVEPVAGRGFRPEDVDATDVMVGARFAQEHFGSAQAAVGQTLTYEGAVKPIVGVMPDGFSFPGKTEVWVEQKPHPDTPNRTAYNQRAIGKRRTDVSPGQLAAELAGFSAHLQKTYVEDQRKAIETVSLQEDVVGPIRAILLLLMGAVAVLLLMVCANVTHLQLVRASRETRSVTIRTALGASRAALTGRALVEATLLALAGCVAALAVAFPALRLLVALAPTNIPRLTDVHLNVDVLIFSFAISLVLMAVTAVLPVWRSWHIDPASALRQDAARGTEGRGSSRLRNGLIVAEVALTLTLSVAGILLTRQLIKESRAELGFQVERLVTLDTHAVGDPPIEYAMDDQTEAQKEAVRAAAMVERKRRLQHLDSLMAEVVATPGVESAAAMLGAPMGFGGSNVGYAVKGRQVFAPPFHGLPDAEIKPVTPNLFTTMRIPLVRGREFTEDDRLGSPPVVLINQELARKIFPGIDPIGQQIMCGYDDKSAWWTIVGVVGDIRSSSPGAAPDPTFYVPVAQHPGGAGDMQLIVRTKGDASAMAAMLRKRLVDQHPDIAIRATTMRENIGNTQRAENFRTMLFGSFAGVSLLLAAVGIFGVTSYSVSQRSFEFGLRIALGADRSQLLAMVLSKALLSTVYGIVAGAILSFALTRILSATLGTLPKADAPSYALASLAVLAIALLATALPARAAANANPMTILRSE